MMQITLETSPLGNSKICLSGFESEVWCTTFHVKMYLTCMIMKHHFQMNICAPGLTKEA